MRASSRAGITARSTATTDRARVFKTPSMKYGAYLGRKVKLTKLAGPGSVNS